MDRHRESSRRRESFSRAGAQKWRPRSLGHLALAVATLALVSCYESKQFDLLDAPLQAFQSEAGNHLASERPGSPLRLLEGFEYDRYGGPFARSLGETSVLEIYVAEPRELEVVFEARHIAQQEGVLYLRLLDGTNGPSPRQRVGIRPGWAEYRVRFEASATRRGSNRLRIDIPEEEGLTGHSRLDVRVLWRRFEVLFAAMPPHPAPLGAHESLTWRAGEAHEWYLAPEAGTQLVLEGVSSRDSSARLHVLWTAEGALGGKNDERHVGVLEPGQSRTLSLPVSTSGKRGRLTLLAESFGRSRNEPLSLESAHLTRPAWPASLRTPSPKGAPSRRRQPTDGDASRPPDLFVFLVDTLRADHLGVYGYPRGTSPHIDRFGHRALIFESAQAQTSWTRGSVASLFTGLRPLTHGVNDQRDALPEEAETLAEILKRHGYATGAFIANGNVGKAFGFDQGFDRFEHLEASKADALIDLATEWLAETPPEKPVLLYVHTIEPHAPYHPAEPWRSRFAGSANLATGSVENVRTLALGSELAPAALVTELIDLYDGEVAEADASFGRFLEELARHRNLDTALVALLSDHGEEFQEHGSFAHGRTLYSEVLRVPLLLRFAGIPSRFAGARFLENVEHVDVFATALHLAGVDLPAQNQGQSLLALLEQRDQGAPSWENRAVSHIDLAGNRASALFDARHKIVHTPWQQEPAFPALFDIEHDPGEHDNLASERPIQTRRLALELARLEDSDRRSALAGVEVELSDDQRRELQALGYLAP